MVARIEPEVRSRIAATYTDREMVIQVSIWHYLALSLVELRDNWWTQLKHLGGELLWPWPTVAKDFMPMIEDFGAALSMAFDLEFSAATDRFLNGMKKFNGIAGTLSGWFLLASVLMGAALGALGFAFGPAGIATVGAGAGAGLALAEEVGIALLVIALATEAAVIAKANFDLRFQNPRIADGAEREKADQEACKAVAGSLISLATLGALMLLADIAAKFAKALASLVEGVPIIRDVTALLKDARKSISELSLKEGKPARIEGSAEVAGPGEVRVDADAPSEARGADGTAAGRHCQAHGREWRSARALRSRSRRASPEGQGSAEHPSADRTALRRRDGRPGPHLRSQQERPDVVPLFRPDLRPRHAKGDRRRGGLGNGQASKGSADRAEASRAETP